MNPICDVGGDYVFNEDGTHTYQPPCTQPVTHRFQPTDPFPTVEIDPAEIAEDLEAFSRHSARLREAEEADRDDA